MISVAYATVREGLELRGLGALEGSFGCRLLRAW